MSMKVAYDHIRIAPKSNLAKELVNWTLDNKLYMQSNDNNFDGSKPDKDQTGNEEDILRITWTKNIPILTMKLTVLIMILLTRIPQAQTITHPLTHHHREKLS